MLLTPKSLRVMVKLKKTILLAVSALLLSASPVNAQGWVKAGKSAAKVAQKALGKGGSKTVKTVSKQAGKRATTTTTTTTTGAAAARAAQQVKVTCTTCKGYGYYYYNGYKYTCSTCNGSGYKITYR
jgi:DnaJ-class molecular chaperone